MSLITRIMWLMTVAVFTSGCLVSYHRAAYPGATFNNDTFEEFGTGDEAYTVGEKDIVRVTFVSGKVVAGEVQAASADEVVITVFNMDRYILQEIRTDEIQLIEVMKKSTSAAATFVFLAAVAVAVPLIVANQQDKFMSGGIF